MKHLLGAFTVLVTVTSTTHLATAGNRTAEQLFRDGRRLAKEGKLAEACDAFERSDQLEPRVGALLNLAACRERQGRIATAYALFLEATLRAYFTLEPRVDFAAERVTALEPIIPSLALEIAAPVAGLVIKRNGAVVASDTWSDAIPLDPAVYTIEASAPDHVTWSTTQQLNAGERLTLAVGPLVANASPEPAVVALAPSATAAEGEPSRDDIAPASPPAKHRYFAVGAAIGVSAGTMYSARNDDPSVLENDHMPIGVRVLGSLPVPHGAVRAIGSLLYTNGLNDKTDSTNTKQLYVLGLSADYVYNVRPHIAVAAGIGFGFDYEVRPAYTGDRTDLARWTTLRASPLIYRLADGVVELGVHTQLIQRGDGVGFVGLAAVDVFLL